MKRNAQGNRVRKGGVRWRGAACLGFLVGTLVACGSSDPSEATTPENAAPAEEQSKLRARPTPRPEVSIRGRVDGFPTGKRGLRVFADLDPEDVYDPFEVARVEAAGKSCALEPDGTFLLGPLQKGQTHSLIAVDPFAFHHPVATDPVEVKVGTTDAVLPYREGADVSFRVVDGETGEPIYKYRVVSIAGSKSRVESLSPNGRGRNRRHPDGHGTLYGIRPGYDTDFVQLFIESSGYYRYAIPIGDWKAGETYDLGELRLQSVAELSFRILDRQTEEPLKGARVVLAELPEQPFSDVDERGVTALVTSPPPVRRELQRVFARTDETGRCRLTPFHAQRLELRVSAPLRAAYTVQPFTLPEESREFTIALERSSRLSLQVTDHEGFARGDSWLVWEGPSPLADRGPLFTDDEGWVVLPKAWPGTYRFHALPVPLLDVGSPLGLSWDPWKDYPARWVELEVPPGETMEARIPLVEMHGMTGFVKRGGQPVKGASIFASPYPQSLPAELVHALLVSELRDYPWLDETDEDGWFVLEGVPAGTLHVQVREEGHGYTHFQTVEWQGGPKDVILDLPTDWPPAQPRSLGPGSPPLTPPAKALARELLER